ncbi:MAG: dihydropteroate synthase [Candidatus Hydrogenedentota bacterium]
MTQHTDIMGILNITPDSFYEKSRVPDPVRARDVAAQMVADGAHWLDVGGESSRPGAEPVGAEEEWRRVAPVLEALEGVGARISIDTCRAETARRALALGASMVNDITGLTGDPDMPAVVAEARCDCVVMHMQGSPMTMQQHPQYNDVVEDIAAYFEERIEALTKAGVREEQIWLDPGFGFGKTIDHNLMLMRRLHAFKRFGRPLLAGTSNKATIGKVLNTPPGDRTEGTAATVAVCIMNGVSCMRVHDVKAMARVARMTDAIVYGRQETHGG